MKMVILKSLFLAGLVLTSAFATQTSKPLEATLQVKPNFDFSLTSREFRVHYSGLGNAFASSQEDAIINIYKNGESQAAISYTVDSTKKNQKEAFYFALANAKTGLYEVEVCAGTTCSERTPALTDMTSDENKKHKLTCEEGTKDAEGAWNKLNDFDLDFVGPLSSDWISDEEFKTIESNLNEALKAASQPANYKTEYSKIGLKKNPIYKKVNEKPILYVAVNYNVAQYKKLFDKKQGDTDSRPKYSHDFCKRKYLLSAHAHLVDKTTHEVKYRYKTTLHLSGVGKQYFILDPKAAETNRKVHVEMKHENVIIADGEYRLHVIFCATEKDGIDSTFCADPIVHSQDFVVQDSESL